MPRPAPTAFRLPMAIWIFLLLCTVPELVLEGADHGLWGSHVWRQAAYGWGGFWPGLFRGWLPNYPGQRWGMFVTYGFLHAGFTHLFTNMVALVVFSLPIVQRVGQVRYVILYALSQIGGGVGFALLSFSNEPMVGASGALFGLAGAWIAWIYRERSGRAEQVWPVIAMIVILAGLNVLQWWSTHGLLAWQAHLGGFVTGWIVAFFLDRRPWRRKENARRRTGH